MNHQVADLVNKDNVQKVESSENHFCFFVVAAVVRTISRKVTKNSTNKKIR